MDIVTTVIELHQPNYVAYWDILEVDYDELDYGDAIFDLICSSQSGWEVTDMIDDLEDILSHIVCGLYIAMFDKRLHKQE